MLTKLSLYDQLLNPALERAKAELKQLQQERAVVGEKAFESAARIRKLKKTLKEGT